MSEYGLKTENDFNGKLSTLIKLVKACEKDGIDIKSVINIIGEKDTKDALKRINDYSYKYTEALRKLKLLQAQQQRASDFGIGEG